MVISKLFDTLSKVSKNIADSSNRSGNATHPRQLLSLFLLGHLVTNAVGVPESPYRQLVQDAQFLKDIKIQEPQRFVIISEGVGNVWGFRVVLSPRVFVKVLKPELRY
jgi:hypothetical protein